MNKQIGDEHNIIFYTDEDNNIKVEVLLENEDVWLTQNALAKLFDTTRNNITLHIGNIYKEEEIKTSSNTSTPALAKTSSSISNTMLLSVIFCVCSLSAFFKSSNVKSCFKTSFKLLPLCGIFGIGSK